MEIVDIKRKDVGIYLVKVINEYGSFDVLVILIVIDKFEEVEDWMVKFKYR